jgi:Gametolysin peptidase M11
VPRRRLVLAAVVATLILPAGALGHGASGLKASKGAFAGEQRVLVVLATWGPQPFAPEQVRETVFVETDAFMRASSFGKTWLTGDVTPWLPALATQPACDTRLIARGARDAATRAGFDLTRYNRWIYLFPRVDCPFAGLAAGEENWLNGSLSRKLVAHELGHTYGLLHANSWECAGGSCRALEYGDPYSTMGRGSGDFNIFEKQKVGWVTNVTRVAAPGRYAIDRIELPSARPQGIAIATASSEYWLEHRLEQVQRPFSSSFLPTGLLVRAGPNPAAPTDALVFNGDNLLLPNPAGTGREALFPGERWGEAGTFELVVVSQAGATLEVDFRWIDRTAPAAPRLLAPTARVGRRGALTVRWDEARDRNSGVARYEVRLDGGPVKRAEADWRVSPSATFRKPRPGTHRVAVVAVDRAGNRSRAAVRRFTVVR